MAITLAPADRRHGGETPLPPPRRRPQASARQLPATPGRICRYPSPHTPASTPRDVWRRGAGRQASSPMWSLAGHLGSATRRTNSHELQTATGRHVQSVRVAGSPFSSHAGRRKTVLAVVKPYPSRFENKPSIDPSTRTAPPLSTTATADIKLLDSICGYDGALAAGSRGCLATRSGLRNGRPWRRVSSSVVFSARLGPILVGTDPPGHWAARAPSLRDVRGR